MKFHSEKFCASRVVAKCMGNFLKNMYKKHESAEKFPLCFYFISTDLPKEATILKTNETNLEANK